MNIQAAPYPRFFRPVVLTVCVCGLLAGGVVLDRTWFNRTLDVTTAISGLASAALFARGTRSLRGTASQPALLLVLVSCVSVASGFILRFLP